MNTYIFYSNTNNIYFIVTDFIFFQTETKEEIRDIYISDGEFADVHEHDNEIASVAIWKAAAKFEKSE